MKKRNLPGKDDRVFRDRGEERAWQELQARGHILIRHNIHLRVIEIDLLTWNPATHTLHLVEVKHWKEGPIHPMETIYKKRKYRMAARLIPELFSRTIAELTSDEFSISLNLAYFENDQFQWFDFSNIGEEKYQ